VKLYPFKIPFLHFLLEKSCSSVKHVVYR